MNKLQQLESKRDELQVLIEELGREIEVFDSSEYTTHEQYDQMLDDCYGEIEVCGLTYSASNLLESVDPIAYRCGFSDYCASLDPSDFVEYRQLEDQLEELQNNLEDIEQEIEEIEESEAE